jgi:hypothetical protein
LLVGSAKTRKKAETEEEEKKNKVDKKVEESVDTMSYINIIR